MKNELYLPIWGLIFPNYFIRHTTLYFIRLYHFTFFISSRPRCIMSNLDFHSKPLAELRNSYWMIQKLGVGGFGKVYLIRHRESREFRAAKHQKWTSSDVPKLIRREVLVLRKLINKVST